MSKAKRREQQRRRAAFVATIGRPRPARRLRLVESPAPYVDPIAVEKAAAGYRVKVRPIELRAAVQILTRRGLSATEIAERVGVCPRTVTRHRGREPVEVSAFG